MKCFESWCTVAKCRVGGSELGAHTHMVMLGVVCTVYVLKYTLLHSAGISCLGASVQCTVYSVQLHTVQM